MPDYHIAIVNSSSFGRVFPHHLERLKSVGDIHFFTVNQEIPGKELAELLKGFNIIIASVTHFFDEIFLKTKMNCY